MVRSPLRRLACVLLAIAGCHAPAARAPAAIANRAHPTDRAVWVYRELSTGLARRGSSVTTYRLIVDGGQATVTVTRAETDAGGDPATARLTGWQDRAPRRFTGAATPDGAALRLELREDGGPVVWRWRCTVAPQDVAPADAVRVPTVTVEECGDEGAWSRPTATVSALVCAAIAPEPEQVYGELPFGAEPGLEYLHVNDDCFQGGGLRRIAADGALANIR